MGTAELFSGKSIFAKKSITFMLLYLYRFLQLSWLAWNFLYVPNIIVQKLSFIHITNWPLAIGQFIEKKSNRQYEILIIFPKFINFK